MCLHKVNNQRDGITVRKWLKVKIKNKKDELDKCYVLRCLVEEDRCFIVRWVSV